MIEEATGFRTFAELRSLVDESGGLTVSKVWRLRRATTWDRLTSRAVEEINTKLDGVGLGVFPAVPLDKDALVRVYAKDSEIRPLVDAVLAPNDIGDALLRRLATGDAETLVRRIRDLVCVEE